MNRSSIFKKKIDFGNSSGSYLFDKDSNKNYLDFFGQYSTLAIGYNHSIFNSKNYLEEIKTVAHQKITNCEILSDESIEFDELFREYTSSDIFSHYHYSCTGALAIEAAIKTAMDYKGDDKKRIIAFKKSFHGINGYGGIITDRFGAVKQRLENFPGSYWAHVDNPIIQYKDGREIVNEAFVNNVLNEVERIINKDNNVCSIIVEPIQCTYGDYYFPISFFSGLRELCTKYDIPLIFDEIQVGFGATGKLWYFEHLPIKPDILVFGKKTQLSGIAVQSKFSEIFKKSIRLEVTWDADIIDMIRCKYIINAYKRFDVINNVNKRAVYLKEGLEQIKNIINIRNCGLLFAFDFEEQLARDLFVKEMFKNNMLCNPTSEKTIRLRPNLCVTSEEINHAIEILRKASKVI